MPAVPTGVTQQTLNDQIRRAGYRVLVMGGFNTAHEDIDLQLEDAAQSVVIYRNGLDVRCALVPDIEALALAFKKEFGAA